MAAQGGVSHIVHLTPYYAPAYAFGGVVRAVEGLARTLAARGHRVTVLTTDAHELAQHGLAPATETIDGVRVLRAPNAIYPLRRVNLSTPVGLARLADAELASADVLHTHEFRTVENLIAVPLAARRGVPVVLSPHGTLATTTGRSALKRAWDRLLSPRLMRQITAVVGLHDQETAEAEAFWGAAGLTPRIATIANGVDPISLTAQDGAAFRARWGLGEAVICLFMGRLHARKGVEALARAFQQVAQPDARLVIAGPDEGMLPLLQTLAAQDPRIVLTGFLDSEARLGALAAADLFALPATGEGLSIAMLEAMAAGLPLLIAPGCHFPLAESAGAGVIVPPEVEPLTLALRGLLADRDRRQAMGTAARRMATEQFTWDAIAVQWEALYLDIRR